MGHKELIQIRGEKYVAKHLTLRGHQILAMNQKIHPFEFDIVSLYKTHRIIHEVRATENVRAVLPDYFPYKKLLSLYKGMQLNYGDELLICHLVVLTKNGKIVRHTSIPVTELL